MSAGRWRAGEFVRDHAESIAARALDAPPADVQAEAPPPRLDASIVTAASVSSATDAMRGTKIGGGR